MSSTSTARSYNYTTIRYLVDEDRDVSVPVGVILSDTDRGELHKRIPCEGERISEVPLASAMPSIELALSKIDTWLRAGGLPYAHESPRALSEGWWEQVRKLMQFRVRIGPVRPIDCSRPDEELEGLYEAIVKPKVRPAARTARVDGAVTKALDRLAPRMASGHTVRGYRDRPISVLRYASDADKAVVIEAVNLAASTAETDAYALSSKLRSIQESNENVSLIVGYLASPGGLNGEASLKEWLEHDAHVQAYDLGRETSAFHDSVRQMLSELQLGPNLFAGE